MMRIKLQNLIIPGEPQGQREPMYAIPKENGTVSYMTYFNSLSIEKWKKYTVVRNIILRLNTSGRCGLRLVNCRLNGETVIKETVLCAAVESDGSSWTGIEIPETVTDGIIGFETADVSDDFRLIGGYYEAEIPEDEAWSVNLALNICTCRRETFIKNNLDVLTREVLNNNSGELGDHVFAYVQDNGQTLDVGSLESSRTRIVYNKNCGGAGGFTRGMIEIMHHMDVFPATHVIMMDDDIELCPESLYRTYAVLRCRRKEYSELAVGGAMFAFEDPTVQIESGAVWDNGRILPNKTYLRMESPEACVLNEREEPFSYNAWWYCCMPMSCIRPDNLPIPIFFTGDDIEYGLRNIRQLYLMNGICVWHESFFNKYSSSKYYYIQRNMLIDNTLHCDGFGPMSFAIITLRKTIKEILQLRYKNAALVLRGTEDFLKGVDFLKRTDPVALHSEIGKYGDRLVRMEGVAPPDRSEWGHPSKEAGAFIKALSYIKILCGAILLPPIKRPEGETLTLHPMYDAIKDTYREKKVVYCTAKDGMGFVAERDRKEATRIFRETFRLVMRATPRYNEVRREYRERLGEITSESFWKEYLGL